MCIYIYIYIYTYLYMYYMKLCVWGNQTEYIFIHFISCEISAIRLVTHDVTYLNTYLDRKSDDKLHSQASTRLVQTYR